MKRRYRGQPSDFGIMLRAVRNCFSYSSEHDAYFRMSWIDDKKQLLRVEACPPRKIHEVTRGQIGSNKETRYLVWNDPPERKKETLSGLNLPNKVSKYESFVINLEGEIVK
jgi:hypothetical protein